MFLENNCAKSFWTHVALPNLTKLIDAAEVDLTLLSEITCKN